MAIKPNTIRFWRRTADLTQWQLAKAVGRTQAWLSKIEAGHVEIDDAMLRKIARQLRVDPSILRGEGDGKHR